MMFLESEIEKEFLRFQELLPVHFPLQDPKYLNSHDVLKAHFQIANHFYLEESGLGGIGPKDIGLLESAVNRQFVGYGTKSKWDNFFDICATLFYGLIKNHPFHDANKRTAVLSVLYQLYKSGWCPTINERKIEEFTVEVAENALKKYKRYQELVREKDEDPEVKYISWYLKNNTRKIEQVPRAVTYRELKHILEKFGFLMENPKDNYIEIIKVIEEEKSKNFLGIPIGKKKKNIKHQKLGRIGFPSWTTEVRSSALKSVREMTELTAKHGVDSGAFFRGLDPMQSLITSYNTLLMRLADR
jgi:death-on-curing protein